MRALAALLLSVAPLACSASPRLSLEDCSIRGSAERMRCGTLRVPENPARPDGREIALHIVVLPALDPVPGRAPLFDLASGPGLAATESAGYYAGFAAFHRRHRDVVLVDQRGTGRSAPLRCPELERASPLAPLFDPDAVERCRSALSKRADLSQYTTANTVADLEAVRAALGYEQVDVTGLSYGTRLALAWIEAAPRRVRSAVLGGVVPVDAKSPLWHARNAQRTLDALLADCAADAACRASFPTLATRWQRVLASPRFDGPAREAFRTLLNGAESLRRVPRLIDAMGRGDFAPFEQALVGVNHGRLALGLYFSIACSEDTQWIMPADRRRASEDTFLGDYRLDRQLAACARWNVPRKALVYGQRTHDVPILLIAGGRDHVTPVAWAEQAIASFPRGRLVVVPRLGHTPNGLAGLACLHAMATTLFDTADASRVDTSCIEHMAPLPFVTD